MSLIKTVHEAFTHKRGPLAHMRPPRPAANVHIPREYPMQAPEAPRRPPIQSACLLKSFEEVRGKAPHIYAHLSIEAVRELAKDMVEDEKVTADQLVAHYGCMSENEKLYMAAKAAIPLSTDKASFYKWTELFYKAVSDD